MRIVLAEDEALLREGLGLLLERAGHDVVASVATVCLIAVGLVRAGVLGGHKATAAASASAHGNAAKVTEPSDRFIISYAENSAAGKVIASAKAYGENVLNSLPAKDK